MITVGYLKKVLADIDDDKLVYAYEGKESFIVIAEPDKNVIIKKIPARAMPKIQDKPDKSVREK